MGNVQPSPPPKSSPKPTLTLNAVDAPRYEFKGSLLYIAFMKGEVARLKEANPALDDKEALSQAAEKWSERTRSNRARSPYIEFMKEEVARLKKANPALDDKYATRKALQNWSKMTRSNWTTSPRNVFMKEELARLKKANLRLMRDHRAAVRQASANWLNGCLGVVDAPSCCEKGSCGKKGSLLYMEFMKEELARQKKANPMLDRKAAFQLASANWSTSHGNRANTLDEAGCGKKAPSPYNVFMKDELALLKEANPTLDDKDAMRQVDANWSKRINTLYAVDSSGCGEKAPSPYNESVHEVGAAGFGKKGSSPYIALLKEELARLKKANSMLDGKDAFKQVASN